MLIIFFDRTFYVYELPSFFPSQTLTIIFFIYNDYDDYEYDYDDFLYLSATFIDQQKLYRKYY